MYPILQVLVWNVGIVKRLLEGEVGWRAVGEAWESAGRLSDTARHVQVVGVTHGGGDRQVGELRVKVPEVSGTGLQNTKETGYRYTLYTFIQHKIYIKIAVLLMIFVSMRLLRVCLKSDTLK